MQTGQLKKQLLKKQEKHLKNYKLYFISHIIYDKFRKQDVEHIIFSFQHFSKIKKKKNLKTITI